MTHSQILQLCLIVAAGFFFLGTLFGILVIAYGKNGLLAVRAKLESQNLSSDGAGKSERTSVEKSSARSSSTVKKKDLPLNGGENDASAQSGPMGARVTLPDNWRQESCDMSGHLFDEDTEHCLRCDAKKAFPNDIEQIRSLAS